MNIKTNSFKPSKLSFELKLRCFFLKTHFHIKVVLSLRVASLVKTQCATYVTSLPVPVTTLGENDKYKWGVGGGVGYTMVNGSIFDFSLLQKRTMVY